MDNAKKKASNSHIPFEYLGEISADEFLANYWQKKPLLIRNAFENFISPVSPDEIAGFSLEEDVTSRLIVETKAETHTKTKPQKENTWQVEHGPFQEERFKTLPTQHWTLMVQYADQLDPQINALLDKFRFIPNWRLDDIMVSYAVDGGGVGPHFDYYDVFLIQGSGQRLWKTGQYCTSNSPILANQPMRVLKNFDTQNEWILNSGDMLYVPPSIAHWGIAQGESITYSVGFRAPSHSEMLLEHAQAMAQSMSEDNRYSDPKLIKQQHAGLITPAVIDEISHTLSQLSQDKNIIQQWLGKISSTPHQPLDISADNIATEISFENLPKITLLQLDNMQRCVYFEKNDIASCFINGEEYTTSILLARKLSEYTHFTIDSLSKSDLNVVKKLYDLGYLLLNHC